MTKADEGRSERRGFASMSAEKQREIARMGGKAAHSEEPRTNGRPKKKAHEWTAEEARTAGRKGGEVSRGGRGRYTGEEVRAQNSAPVVDAADRDDQEPGSAA